MMTQDETLLLAAGPFDRYISEVLRQQFENAAFAQLARGELHSIEEAAEVVDVLLHDAREHITRSKAEVLARLGARYDRASPSDELLATIY